MTSPRPRRLTPPSAPGALLKSFEGPAPRPRKDGGERDVSYRQNVQACPCLHCGMEPSEAAHVRYASAAFGKSSGLQKKPSDCWVLPLCADCHRLARDAQHNRSEQQFWNGLGINPLMVAERLYAQRGDLVAMRAVVFVAIAERSRK